MIQPDGYIRCKMSARVMRPGALESQAVLDFRVKDREPILVRGLVSGTASEWLLIIIPTVISTVGYTSPEVKIPDIGNFLVNSDHRSAL